MKKSLITILVLAFSWTALADVIQVKTPLKDQEIYKVIYKSAEKFLEYEGEEIHGGLYGDLTNPTIIEVTKKGSKVTSIKVEYTAFFFTTDWDFGDPVHEEFTKCTSTLKKISGKYSIQNTKTNCDFNPAIDID